MNNTTNLTFNSDSKAFKQLLAFVELSKGDCLSIAFAQTRHLGDRITDYLLTQPEHLNIRDIQFRVLDLNNPALFGDNFNLLKKALRTIGSHLDPAKKTVLLCVNLDLSIENADINFIGAAFRETFPHPVIFFLPEETITNIARHAPDFWTYNHVTFFFDKQLMD